MTQETYAFQSDNSELLEWKDDWEENEKLFDYYGFVEAAYGKRYLANHTMSSKTTLNETRLRFELDKQFEALKVKLSSDIVYDDISSKAQAKLRTGYAEYSPVESLSFKVGRQILTWGTGDYVFINDLFPKDWQSFFSGRDDEYLKLPSDSIKTSWFYNSLSIQFIWTPEFEPDNIISGERFSYFSPKNNQLLSDPLKPVQQNSYTWSLKLASSIKGTDYAIYVHKGFWPTPNGLSATLQPYYPKLNVFGASVQAALFQGVFNSEVAWYDSYEDTNGTLSHIPNSQIRALVGYEQEIFSNFTISTQYYLEHLKDYKKLKKNSAFPEFEHVRNRQLLTLRLRWLTFQQKLTLGIFGFWSPTDKDSYFRPNINYRHNDEWSFSAGLNIFKGSTNSTFFGQHNQNSNFWLSARYNY